MAQYIRFDKTEETFNGHPIYKIINKRHGDVLGRVFWYAVWKQYVFIADSGTAIWSKGCLEDVIAFIDTLGLDTPSTTD